MTITDARKSDENNRVFRCTSSTIFDAIQYLLLPNTCAALATTYLYNYELFSGQYGDEYDEKNEIVTAAIYLSCKLSENHRSIRDIYNIIAILENPDISLGTLDTAYVDAKHRIVEKEHEILRIMKFHVEIDLPHAYLLNVARYLCLSQAPVYIGWALLNDCMSSPCFSTSKPHIVAVVCLEVGIQICRHRCIQISLQHHDPFKADWYKEFSVNDEEFTSVAQWVIADWKNYYDAKPSENAVTHN